MISIDSKKGNNKILIKIYGMEKNYLSLSKEIKSLNEKYENIKLKERLLNLSIIIKSKEKELNILEKELNFYLKDELFVYTKSIYEDENNIENKYKIAEEYYQKLLDNNIQFPLNKFDKLKIIFSIKNKNIIKKFNKYFNINFIHDKDYISKNKINYSIESFSFLNNDKNDLIKKSKKLLNKENIKKYFLSINFLPLLNKFLLIEVRYNELKLKIEEENLNLLNLQNEYNEYNELLKIKINKLLELDKQIFINKELLKNY